MSINAIFWDNDGVLVDTEHLYYLSNKAIFDQEETPFTMETYIDISLTQGKSALELFYDKGYSKEDVEQLRLKRNDIFSQLLEDHNDKLLIDGVKDVLDALKDQYFMAIVTSCRKEHFKIIHRFTGTLDYFQFILANGDYPRSKPNPDPYLMALEKSGFKPEECIVIEDTERGLKAAHAAGLRCLIIPHELTSNGDFSLAHSVLNNISEVPECLKSL